MLGWNYDDALAERRSCVLSAFPSAPRSLSSCCSLLSRLRACKTASPKETIVKPKVVSKKVSKQHMASQRERWWSSLRGLC